MKVCRTCGDEKDLSEFSLNKAKSDGHHSKCKACHRAYVRQHYQRHKDYYVKKARRAKVIAFERAKTFILAYLASHPCVDCGEPDPLVLDFDHVRGQKDNSISVLAFSFGAPLNRIQKEIDKCEIRCSNCHRRKTAKQFGWKAYLVPEDVSLRSSVKGSGPEA